MATLGLTFSVQLMFCLLLELLVEPGVVPDLEHALLPQLPVQLPQAGCVPVKLLLAIAGDRWPVRVCNTWKLPAGTSP